MLNNSFLNYLKRAEFEPVLTKFLDVTELSELINMIGNDHKYLINGGYEDAERVRVIISPDEDVDFSSFEIKIIKIDYPTKFVKINHRNVLGTIMSLGIIPEQVAFLRLFVGFLILTIYSLICLILLPALPCFNPISSSTSFDVFISYPFSP